MAATLYPSIIQTTLNTLLSAILPGIPKRVKISLTSAQILALNSTPILCVAAPGTGYFIRVLRASAMIIEGDSSAYATHEQLDLYTATGLPQASTLSTFLNPSGAGAGDSRRQYFNDTVALDDEDVLLSNAALYVTVPGGNPTAGDGTVMLYITYEIIAL